MESCGVVGRVNIWAQIAASYATIRCAFDRNGHLGRNLRIAPQPIPDVRLRDLPAGDFGEPLRHGNLAANDVDC